MTDKIIYRDDILLSTIARLRGAWLAAEMHWNEQDRRSLFGAVEIDSTCPGEALSALDDAKGLLSAFPVQTMRGAWAYLALVRDLLHNREIDPESSISADVNLVQALAKITDFLEGQMSESDDSMPARNQAA